MSRLHVSADDLGARTVAPYDCDGQSYMWDGNSFVPMKGRFVFLLFRGSIFPSKESYGSMVRQLEQTLDLHPVHVLVVSADNHRKTGIIMVPVPLDYVEGEIFVGKSHDLAVGFVDPIMVRDTMEE